MEFPFKTALKILFTGAACFAASTVHAQATRTWVSGVGDDVNPCSRTAPCKTFAGAISKTATNGEINTLDSGGFGAVTITKSITINGKSTIAGVLTNAANAINVNLPAGSTVTLRNLEIDGLTTATHGINFIGGGDLHVEDVQIFGFAGQGINFAPTVAGTSFLFVNNTSIRNAMAGGILVKPGASADAVATVNGSVLDGNARGLRAEDGATVVVRNSHASGNDANGFVAVGVSRAVDMTLESCVSAGNGATGVYAGALSTVRLSNVMVTRNLDGLQMVGGTTISYGNNRLQGNINSNNAPSSNIGQQ